jgi:hypothetical protein
VRSGRLGRHHTGPEEVASVNPASPLFLKSVVYTPAPGPLHSLCPLREWAFLISSHFPPSPTVSPLWDTVSYYRTADQLPPQQPAS